ncbi:polar amino acid transport system permease protein [Limimaricola variabilis]|uniref:Polar amino acid transport system permease protein n=1 Tax=Limimaricola variabilis TaxID=1492771 RepID=A0ABR6HR11_9RHOB|nr:amino acid ABC transporter permease [Limimaricola variabilis]MBB3712989.1 polar amino acid transport system permease protein [Limimaricola variabilis]
MTQFTFVDILTNLLWASRWTVLLSLAAFAGGGLLALGLLFAAIGRARWPGRLARLYVEIFQGTPLLMQLFLAFFGLGLLGIDVSPWLAACAALILWSAAFLVEIWRGCVMAIGRGQWEASAALGMGYAAQMRHVVLPQALRLAVPPTVGFSVQVVKGTALTSIIGFLELTKAGTVLSNASFQPFTVFGLVALIYFALCFPLSVGARRLERKLNVAH